MISRPDTMAPFTGAPTLPDSRFCSQVSTDTRTDMSCHTCDLWQTGDPHNVCDFVSGRKGTHVNCRAACPAFGALWGVDTPPLLGVFRVGYPKIWDQMSNPL